MSNIVIDTNVLLSGMLWRGPAYKALQIATDSYQLVQNDLTLKEFVKVINRPKFKKILNRRQYTPDMLINALFRQASFYEIKPSVCEKVLRIAIEDKDDLKFIELAKVSNSRIIVTGDKHLLELKNVDKIRIISVSEFIAMHNNIGPS